MKNQKINLIFMGGFTFPDGMAGTKRILHAVDALLSNHRVEMRVLLLRQLKDNNSYSGEYKGIPYHTIMNDMNRKKFLFLFPVLFIRAIICLKSFWKSNYANIIYHYGPLSHDNFFPLIFARFFGYKIVFDIVEDYDVAKTLSKSYFHKLRNFGIRKLQSIMLIISGGIIVISSYLEAKFMILTTMPLHYRPISIDMSRYMTPPVKNNDTQKVSLFYAGSFGRKDGILNILDAFDNLAKKRDNVHLILTGRGTNENMSILFSRIDNSPFKDRIDFKGYLDEESYYKVLNSVDIHCMTRIDIDYSHAGFPFKLGEYLASGKPVIASRVSDVNRFLKDRHNAMLINPGRSEEIESAATTLIENSEIALKIGRAGRTTAFNNFDHMIQGKKLFQFFERV